MKKILVQTPSEVFANNHIFSGDDVNGSTVPWLQLKNRLFKLGYNIMTADDQELTDCEGIIFIDAHSLSPTITFKKKIKNLIKKLLGMKVYPTYPIRNIYEEAVHAGLYDKLILLIGEARAICPENFSSKTLNKFNHVLTWDDDLLTTSKYIRYWKPMETPHIVEKATPFNQKKLLVNISFNKYSTYHHELYSERRKLISYFESYYPNDFDLYGLRWNQPITRLQIMFPFLVKKYSTFRGRSKDKIETLSHYKFNVAYENISDAKGYIADRIFSAFQAKSVPIYWGAPNIKDYVDADTFIDRRQFKNNAELSRFLKKMTEERYNGYIKAIERFMGSEKYAKFLPESFSTQVIKALKINAI